MNRPTMVRRASTSGCLGLAVLLSSIPQCNAEAPDAAQVANALQELMVDAIAIGEKSVVAISRVGKNAQQPAVALRFPFGATRQSVDPTSPDFIPSDFGSGVIVGDDGLILTTLHVLGDVDTSAYYVWHHKRPFLATIVATAPWYDLAVLKIEGEDFVPIEFGDASTVQKGNIVIALGNPAAIAHDGNVSASWGNISNIQRRAPPIPSRSNEPLGRETLHHYGTLIQTDAELDFGYSGGALLNLDGKMIGLTTSYAASLSSERAAGLAIPVDAAFSRIVNELKSGKTPEFGFLGVGPDTLNVALRQQGHHGARLVSVMVGTPAERAGLQADDIVTHINGAAIFDESDLFWRIGILPPGSTAELRLVRGNFSDSNVAVIDAQATVSKKYVNTIRKPIITAELPNWRGMRVDYATASPVFSQMVNRPAADSLYVVDVVEDSAAWRADIRAGQFVTHIGDVKVATPAAFDSSVRDVPGAVTLHVTIDGRDTAERTISP